MTEEERLHLSSLSLQEKINYSKIIIKESLKKFGSSLVLAWTGGKDSTTMLWLYKETCDEIGSPLPRCIFINEGDVFNEILEMVGKVKEMWNVDVIELKNNDVLKNVKRVGDIVIVKELNKRNRMELEYINFNEKEFSFERVLCRKSPYENCTDESIY